MLKDALQLRSARQAQKARRDRKRRRVSRLHDASYVTGAELFVDGGFAQV
jgi:hypothetical protein